MILNSEQMYTVFDFDSAAVYLLTYWISTDILFKFYPTTYIAGLKSMLPIWQDVRQLYILNKITFLIILQK